MHIMSFWKDSYIICYSSPEHNEWNFIIFLCSVHRAAIDFHLRSNNNKKTNRYNRGLQGLSPTKQIQNKRISLQLLTENIQNRT